PPVRADTGARRTNQATPATGCQARPQPAAAIVGSRSAKPLPIAIRGDMPHLGAHRARGVAAGMRAVCATSHSSAFAFTPAVFTWKRPACNARCIIGGTLACLGSTSSTETITLSTIQRRIMPNRYGAGDRPPITNRLRAFLVHIPRYSIEGQMRL